LGEAKRQGTVQSQSEHKKDRHKQKVFSGQIVHYIRAKLRRLVLGRARSPKRWIADDMNQWIRQQSA
jgi:hypothetical protein